MGSGSCSCRSTMAGFSAELEPDGIARELAGTGGVGKDSAAICQRADLEANVRKLMLTTASILALGIGGAGVSQAADTSNMGPPNAGSNMPAMSGVPSASQTIVNPSRDQV